VQQDLVFRSDLCRYYPKTISFVYAVEHVTDKINKPPPMSSSSSLVSPETADGHEQTKQENEDSLDRLSGRRVRKSRKDAVRRSRPLMSYPPDSAKGWPVVWEDEVHIDENAVSNLMATMSIRELRAASEPYGVDRRQSKLSLAMCVASKSILFRKSEVANYTRESLLRFIKELNLSSALTAPVSKTGQWTNNHLRHVLVSHHQGFDEDVEDIMSYIQELYRIGNETATQYCSSEILKQLQAAPPKVTGSLIASMFQGFTGVQQTLDRLHRMNQVIGGLSDMASTLNNLQTGLSWMSSLSTLPGMSALASLSNASSSTGLAGLAGVAGMVGLPNLPDLSGIPGYSSLPSLSTVTNGITTLSNFSNSLSNYIPSPTGTSLYQLKETSYSVLLVLYQSWLAAELFGAVKRSTFKSMYTLIAPVETLLIQYLELTQQMCTASKPPLCHRDHVPLEMWKWFESPGWKSILCNMTLDHTAGAVPIEFKEGDQLPGGYTVAMVIRSNSTPGLLSGQEVIWTGLTSTIPQSRPSDEHEASKSLLLPMGRAVVTKLAEQVLGKSVSKGLVGIDKARRFAQQLGIISKPTSPFGKALDEMVDFATGTPSQSGGKSAVPPGIQATGALLGI
jgi:hypothetical protein